MGGGTLLAQQYPLLAVNPARRRALAQGLLRGLLDGVRDAVQGELQGIAGLFRTLCGGARFAAGLTSPDYGERLQAYVR